MSKEEILKICKEIQERAQKLKNEGCVSYISAVANADGEMVVSLNVTKMPEGCDLYGWNSSSEKGDYRSVFAIEEGIHINRDSYVGDADYEQLAAICDR